MMMNFYILCFMFLTVGNVFPQELYGSFVSKFKRYEKGAFFSGTSQDTWSAIAWKNERIYKQIILWSDVDLSSITYNIECLVNGDNKIRASNIRLLFAEDVKSDLQAKGCSSYSNRIAYVDIADALKGEEVTKIDGNTPLKILVVIDIPKTSTSGTYSGHIGINNKKFSIQVNVVDYTISDVSDWKFHLDLWQFPVSVLEIYNTANSNDSIDIWSDRHFGLLEEGYKMLARSGQKVITTYIKENALGAPSMIKWINDGGDWSYDFTVFDKYVTALMSWGIDRQISCFSPTGWNKEEIIYTEKSTDKQVTLNATVGSDTYTERWDHFLSAFKVHLDDKKWFNKVVLQLDEEKDDRVLEEIIRLVKSNNGNWKIGLAHTKVIREDIKASLYDMSGILYDDLGLSTVASQEGREGKVTTFYTSCTQTIPNNYVTLQNSTAEMTWMAWYSLKENLNGYLRWAYDNWKLLDSYDARDGSHTSGDFSMVYRDSNTSLLRYITSFRLEMLREGIEDYEKVHILRSISPETSSEEFKQLLSSLNEMIEKFSYTSGVGAAILVSEAEKILSEISLVSLPFQKENLQD